MQLQKIYNKLTANEGLGKYFKNAAWLFLEKGLRIVEAFFVGLWIARYLGPADYGILSYSQSFVFLFTAIATLGLDQIVVKELVETPDRRDEILGTTFFLKLSGFIMMFLLLFLSLQLTSSDSSTRTIVLIIGASVLFQSLNGIDFYFQSKVLSKYTVYINIIVISIAAIAKVVLILNNAPLLYFAYVFVLETLLMASGYLICYALTKHSISQWRVKLSMAKKLLNKSWVLIIGSLAAALYMKIDQVMIKEIMDETAVGYYGAAVKLCSIWVFVTVVITQSVFPSLVKAKKQSQQLFLDRLQLLYNLLLKIAVIAAVIYTVFANFLVGLLGSEYAESSPILVIYVWSILFVFLSNGSWGFYLNENLEKFSSVRLVIGAVINIVLNLFFIEKFGLLGAAYATLISYAISGYLVNGLFRKTRPNFYLQTKSFINLFNLKTWIKPI